MSTRTPFKPDYAVPPGATLRETLEAKGISQSALASRTGLAEKTISQIVNGVAPVSYETAEKLEMAIGIPASFWNQMEATYRAHLLRVAENHRHEAAVKWLSELPIKDLLSRGLLQKTKDKADLVRQCLRFFGASSVNAWRTTWQTAAVQFRGGETAKKKIGHAATWLRIGELLAERVSCKPFDASVFRAAIGDLRAMTTKPVDEWRLKLRAFCADAGVVIAVVPEIPGASISGAARWLTPTKVLIQLSLKYKQDDQFWFSLFHEAGHILLHGKKAIFIEHVRRDSPEEREANLFARDVLIPKAFVPQLPFLRSAPAIRNFAREVGVCSGIVVGRLHHDGFLHPSQFRELIGKYEWAM